jgi:hypothetical protein
MTTFRLPLDVPEAHAVLAALALYEALLAHCREVGGDAAIVAEEMGPIAERVSRRLSDGMYDPTLALGDHHIGVGR